MSLESLQQQYNLLHNLLDKLEDQCQLWIEKQDITCAYASSIVNLISQQNDAKSFLKKDDTDTIVKQGNKPCPRNYLSDFTSNGTTVVSYLPPFELQSTYEIGNNHSNNSSIPTMLNLNTTTNTRERCSSVVSQLGTKYDVELQDDTPAIISFLSYYPNVIEKLLVKQQYNIEETIKKFKEEAEEFSDIRETMVKIRHDAKNSVRMAYHKALEYDENPKSKNEEDGEPRITAKIIDKMNSMEKANIPLVDMEIWIDRIVTSYERECTVKEYLLKRLREGSLIEMSDWTNWNVRWNSQSYLDFGYEQEVRDKIQAYKLLKIYEREREKEI